MRIHLDTDFAGDPDDACALAMLLGWPDVELTGITTVADPDGRRAGYVRRLLDLAGRSEIEVAVGAGTSSTDGRAMGALPDHDRYWGGARPRPCEVVPGAATALLTRSLAAGASVAAIGPLTNLAELERDEPGRLSGAPVVAMAGWFDPVAVGLPRLGPAGDWNVQCDPRAARVVAERVQLTLVPLSTTLRAWFRRQDAAELVTGELGALLVRQASAYREDAGKADLAAAHPGLPNDLLNFHHDPLTAAVAAGWDGVVVEQVRLVTVEADGALAFRSDPSGRLTRVVVEVDQERFRHDWAAAVRRAGG